MRRAPTISREKPASPALDFETLRGVGIDYVTEVVSGLLAADPSGSGAWTDHNVHDPGITLLELLCYGITDVAYRTTFSNADLFAVPSSEEEPPKPDEPPFVTARHALTNEPVTLDDYRRVLLDAFPGELRNVWVEPAPQPLYADTKQRELAHAATSPYHVEFSIEGLYRIRCLFYESVSPTRQAEILDTELPRVFHAHRNLAEDLVLPVQATPLHPIFLCAEIELRADADVDEALAALLFAVRRFLTPEVPRRTLAELVARGLSVEEIFEGPPLRHGFILKEDLDAAASVRAVRVSDLIRVLLDVEAIRAVRHISLAHAESSAEAEEWELPIPAGYEPVLDPTQVNIRFYKGKIPFQADAVRARARLTELEAAALSALPTTTEEDFAVPSGTPRVAELTTLQESLPAVYGTGSRGHRRDRTPESLARAKQLQAFLLIFDQLLASYLAQLANVGKLFSLDASLRRSFFVKAVSDIPELGPLLRETAGSESASEEDVAAAYERLVEETTSAGDDWIERRSRLLEHVLARFGETFTDYVLMHYSSVGRLSPAETLEAKRKFLEELPVLASHRARGHDIADPDAVWDTPNVAGVARRVARLLGFPSYERRSLSTITYELYEELDEDDVSEIRFRIVDPVSSVVLLSGTTRYPDHDQALAEMRRAARLGQSAANYRILQAVDGRYYFNVVDVDDDIVATRKQRFATEAEAEANRDALIAFLANHFSEEGLFVIENVLLRPRGPDWPLLPVPCEASTSRPSSWDPYSHRVHVVFPGYSTRLAEPGFRRAVEETLRRELPAHLLCKVCFVGKEQLSAFETAYRAWLESLATGAPDRAAAEALIAVLLELHTVHPRGTLHDCREDGDENNPIILNQTHLGSLPSPPVEPEDD